jgi:MFS transporter, Spinster family, sphingosine-1-phosphate transporter
LSTIADATGGVAGDLKQAGKAIEPGYARNFLFLLFVINLLNYIDRNAVTGLLEPIRKDFGATDAQMGLVGLAFLATYALLPPLFGWFGDRYARKTIIAWSATFWCFATAAAGLSRGVFQLSATRAAVGVGEASYMANAPSMIADLYKTEKRGSALSLFYVASPVGSALGVAIAGVLAGWFGWRSACFLVAAPGLIAAYVMSRMREPVRGSTEVDIVSRAAPPLRETLRYLLRNRAYVIMVIAYTGTVFAQNAVEFWLPTVLQRDKGIPIAEANALYGSMVMAAGLTGPLAGAFIANLFIKRTPGAYHYVSAAAGLLTALPLIIIVLAFNRPLLFTGVFLEAFLGNLSVGIAIAILVSVVLPELRATATAVMLTTVHVFGDVISQPLVGKLSTMMEGGHLAALPAALGLGAEHHLSVALFVVATPAVIFAGIFYLLGSREDLRPQPMLSD